MSFYVSLDFTPTPKELEDLKIYNSRAWSLLSIGINNTKSDNFKPTIILKNIEDFEWYLWNLLFFIASIEKLDCIEILNSFANNYFNNNSRIYINEFIINNSTPEDSNYIEYVFDCYIYILTKTKVINFKKLVTKEEVLNKYCISKYEITEVNSKLVYSYSEENFKLIYPTTTS